MNGISIACLYDCVYLKFVVFCLLQDDKDIEDDFWQY